LLVGILFAQLMRRTGNWDHGFEWERAFLLRTHVRLPEVIDTLFLVLPWLGTNITLIPLVAGGALWLFVRRKRPDLALHLITVQLGSFTLNPVLKAIFDRPRPDLFELRGQFAWAAFPSGHAIASVSVLLTVALLLRRERGWRWPMPLAIGLLVFSLYSRLYLGVHWPTDVVGGILIGFVWLGATYAAFRGPVVRESAPSAGRSPAPGR
jgi:undecaprenyl-diphosphatase